MGSVLNNYLASRLSDLSQTPFAKAASQFNSNFNFQNLDINAIQAFLTKSVQQQIETRLATLPQPLQSQVTNSFHQFISTTKEALTGGIANVFLVVTFIMGLALITSFFLKEIPLRHTHEEPDPEALAAERAQIPVSNH